MFLPHYVENFITAIIFINRRAKRRGRLQIDHLQLLTRFSNLCEVRYRCPRGLFTSHLSFFFHIEHLPSFRINS